MESRLHLVRRLSERIGSPDEAFSDISEQPSNFQAAARRWPQPRRLLDWQTLARRFRSPPSGHRSLADPLRSALRSLHLRYRGQSDNGGVHINAFDRHPCVLSAVRGRPHRTSVDGGRIGPRPTATRPKKDLLSRMRELTSSRGRLRGCAPRDDRAPRSCSERTPGSPRNGPRPGQRSESSDCRSPAF